MTEIALRPMSLADISAAMRLKRFAGWNQVEADWQLLLSLSRGGSFVARIGAGDVGTVTTVTYSGGLSWIGMMLVDPAFRRRGIGTLLLRAAIAVAQPLGRVALDATPAGRPLYERLGFTARFGLIRLGRRAAPLESLPSPGTPAIESDLPALAVFDTSAFGASREPVLRDLLHRLPECAQVAWRGDQLAGYALARRGSSAIQIGPIIAESREDALLLLRSSLRHAAYQDTIIDVPEDRADWIEELCRMGYVPQRPFTRMGLDDGALPGEPELQWAIAGPEYG